jgi:hypothetical protein
MTAPTVTVHEADDVVHPMHGPVETAELTIL